MTQETLSFSAAAGTICLVTWPLFSSCDLLRHPDL
jgi:hypothetical protein